MDSTSLIYSNKVQDLDIGLQQETEPKENQNLQKLRKYENKSDSDSSSKDTTQGRVLLKLLVHSLAMFTIPFIAYYCIRDFAEKEYKIQSPRSYIYGAIGAVISVQIIIGSYIYQAFKEEWFGKTKKKAT